MTRREFVSSAAWAALAGLPPLLAGCAPKVEPPLRVGTNIWPGYEPLYLARALGLLDQHPIKLVEYTSTPEAIRSFRNGALEVIAVAGDEFLRLASQEPSVKAFLITDFSNGADALVAQNEFDCVRKLEGKRIGVEVNATGVFLLTRALAAVGMTRSEIQVVPLENDQHLDSFTRREVEAVVTFEPRRTQLLKAGGRVLFDSSRMPAEQPDVLIAREGTIQTRLNRLRTIAEVWFKARDMMIEKPLEAAHLTAPREGLTPAEFVQALKLLSLPSLQENRRLLSTADSELMAGLTRMHRVLHEFGQVEAAVPSLSLFTKAVLP